MKRFLNVVVAFCATAGLPQLALADCGITGIAAEFEGSSRDDIPDIVVLGTFTKSTQTSQVTTRRSLSETAPTETEIDVITTTYNAIVVGHQISIFGFSRPFHEDISVIGEHYVGLSIPTGGQPRLHAKAIIFLQDRPEGITWVPGGCGSGISYNPSERQITQAIQCYSGGFCPTWLKDG